MAQGLARRIKLVKCRTNKCKLRNEKNWFKLVTYKSQQQHHKQRVQRQKNTRHMPNIENENELLEQISKSEDLLQSTILERVYTIDNRRIANYYTSLR